MHQNKNKTHVPVLLSEVLRYLKPQGGEAYLDLTAGYGGHAKAVLEQTKADDRAVLVDRDESAVEELKRQFGGSTIMRTDFLDASQKLHQLDRTFDCILADLGVSSAHLDITDRGFSVKSDGPLDMRMDRSQQLTAETIVNTYDLKALTEILKNFGEEPKAYQIAQRIIAKRPLKSTGQLAEIVAGVWPGHSRVHPATRTFQALRIAVNDELSLLSRALPIWIQQLNPAGRLAVITFHSLEDRIVKQAFAALSGERYDAELQLLTKRPVTASPTEIVSNPRARSAKLRAVAKIKTKEGEGNNANSGKKPLPSL